MKPFGLGKAHKLCSKIAIEALFRRDGDSNALIAYPLRVVWRVNPGRRKDPSLPQFLITIPKKKIRHAVDRVLLRRRVREAYRLNRQEIFGDTAAPVDMAFIYLADKIVDYKQIDLAMVKSLKKIAQQCSPSSENSSAGF